MAGIGVLVVDDSVVIRRIISSVLDDDPDITVVGTASNGRIALDKLDALRPDIVILDVEMPVMDGLATLRELRRTHPTLPVVMFSTVTERGAMATLDALAAGASDYVTKPTHATSATASVDRVRAELIPKIKGLVGAARTRALFAKRPLPKAPTPASLSGSPGSRRRHRDRCIDRRPRRAQLDRDRDAKRPQRPDSRGPAHATAVHPSVRGAPRPQLFLAGGRGRRRSTR